MRAFPSAAGPCFVAVLALLAIPACLTAKPTSIYGDSYSATYVSSEGNSLATTVNIVIPHEKYRLRNGLQVILNEDHKVPLVSLNLLYTVGSKDDPPGRGGLAHLVEHLMFGGSRHVAPGTFFTQLVHAGATEYNGMTERDSTTYWETLPAKQLELALWLESDRLAFFLDGLKPETLDRERRIVENEWRERVENIAYGQVGALIETAIFPASHPYHQLPYGTAEDLERVTMDDVRKFAVSHYLPNNGTLVLSGDFAIEDVKKMVEKYFGDIVPGPDTPLPAPDPLASFTGRRLQIEARVDTPLLVLSWPTPPFGTQADADLDIAADMLRGHLFREKLFGDRPLAQWMRARQDSSKLGSVFQIWTMPKKGVSLETLEKTLQGFLAEIPVPGKSWLARYLAWSREQDLYFSIETGRRRASKLNFYNFLTGNPGYIQDDVARYDSVNNAGLQKTIGQYLTPQRCVVAQVVPNPAAPVGGRLAKEGS